MLLSMWGTGHTSSADMFTKGLLWLCCVVQRGIDLASLDVSYFTSLSYYILLLFGLRGVFALVFR